MKTTVYFDDFNRAFQDCRPNNFSYEGLEVLFNYLTELENDTGEDMELDVIALCCDFSEDSVEDIIRNYSIDCDDIEDDEIDNHIKDYLEYKTILVGVTADGNFIYQNF